MRRRTSGLAAALATMCVGVGCGGHSGQAAGSRPTTTAAVPTTVAGPTTTLTPQAARANARCLLGNDGVSTIMAKPYAPPRQEASGGGKACRYEADDGTGSVVITLKVGASASDLSADRQPFDLSGPPTKDWAGVGSDGFTVVNATDNTAAAGVLVGNAEVLVSTSGSAQLAPVEDLVKACVGVLLNSRP